jgi:hypothetical protein
MKKLLIYLAAGCCGLNANTPSLHDALAKAGSAVAEFWANFSAINCRETVYQRKLNKEGKVIAKKESAFDYIVFMRDAEGDLAVEESRSSLNSKESGKAAPFLVTNGFSTLLFVFHPQFQNSFEYSQPAEEELAGQRTLRIGFRQAKEGRALACLRSRGRDFPLEWAGSAWFDPQTGRILKITAALHSSMEDVGLQALNAEVTYAPVRFAGAQEEQWLPSTASIEASTPRQRWQNIHRFTAYKRFVVDTNAKSEAPKQ